MASAPELAPDSELEADSLALVGLVLDGFDRTMGTLNLVIGMLLALDMDCLVFVPNSLFVDG